MRTILLTGATGFIGRHCLELLTSGGYDVHAVSRNPPRASQLQVKWHGLDLMDTKQVEEFVRQLRPTYLLHLAWNVEPGNYWESTENIRWVETSLSLLRAFVRNGGRRVVVAGTCAEYDWRHGYCSELVTPRNPNTLYGTCKNSLHGMLEAMAQHRSRFSFAWGHIFFVYGPDEPPGRLIPSTVCSLLKDEVARCLHGQHVRDYLHVGDAASALVALVGSSVTGAVNIASGRPLVLKDIVYRIAAKLDRESSITVANEESDEPPMLVADSRRLNKDVGWQPRFDLDAGLDDTIAWWTARLAKEDKGSP